jgi:choline dehydrogenase-like flavoprotein
VLFDCSDTIRNPRAVGVEFRVRGRQSTCRIQNVRREIVLSAGDTGFFASKLLPNNKCIATGSVMTPDILETSGIGDPDILRQNGIDCIAELAGVGSNFRKYFILLR